MSQNLLITVHEAPRTVRNTKHSLNNSFSNCPLKHQTAPPPWARPRWEPLAWRQAGPRPRALVAPTPPTSRARGPMGRTPGRCPLPADGVPRPEPGRSCAIRFRTRHRGGSARSCPARPGECAEPQCWSGAGGGAAVSPSGGGRPSARTKACGGATGTQLAALKPAASALSPARARPRLGATGAAGCSRDTVSTSEHRCMRTGLAAQRGPGLQVTHTQLRCQGRLALRRLRRGSPVVPVSAWSSQAFLAPRPLRPRWSQEEP